jgi:hypothetical protein
MREHPKWCNGSHASGTLVRAYQDVNYFRGKEQYFRTHHENKNQQPIVHALPVDLSLLAISSAAILSRTVAK